MAVPFRIPLVDALPPIKAGGKNPAPFAESWAQYVGAAWGVPFSDARQAYKALFDALGLKPGDQVLVSACSTVPLWNAMGDCKLSPIVLEPEPYTLNLNGKSVDAALWARLDAVVVTHLWGRPAHLETLVADARKFGVPVIEDALHAQGAEYRGKRVGGFGDAAVFCFRETRVLGDVAGGAVVVSSREDLHKELATHANDVFTGAPGARLHARLKMMDSLISRREAVAELYRQLLGETEGIRTALPERQGRHVYYRFVVRISDAERMQAYLAEKGIETGRPSFRALLLKDGELPTAASAAREILYLPLALSLGDAGVEEVSAALRAGVLAGPTVTP